MREVIVPIVEEDQWLPLLRCSAPWQSPSSPVLIVAPHPDDETLAIGGLISTLRSQGIDVTVAAVTDGEAAYDDGVPIAAVRAAEQQSALSILGVSPDRTVRLQLPDSNLVTHETSITNSLLPLSPAGTHVIAPWPADYHPDHEACGRAAHAVAQQTGARLTYYLFWAWHRGTLQQLRNETLRTFPLNSSAARAKEEALQCHASQLHHVSGAPILPHRLLAPARWPFEVYLDA